MMSEICFPILGGKKKEGSMDETRSVNVAYCWTWENSPWGSVTLTSVLLLCLWKYPQWKGKQKIQIEMKCRWLLELDSRLDSVQQRVDCVAKCRAQSCGKHTWRQNIWTLNILALKLLTGTCDFGGLWNRPPWDCICFFPSKMGMNLSLQSWED